MRLPAFLHFHFLAREFCAYKIGHAVGLVMRHILPIKERDDLPLTGIRFFEQSQTAFLNGVGRHYEFAIQQGDHLTVFHSDSIDLDAAGRDDVVAQLVATSELDADAYFPVSARTGKGLDALIEQQLDTLRTQVDEPASELVNPTPSAPSDRTPPQSLTQDYRTTRNGARPASGPQARLWSGGRGGASER